MNPSFMRISIRLIPELYINDSVAENKDLSDLGDVSVRKLWPVLFKMAS